MRSARADISVKIVVPNGRSRAAIHSWKRTLMRVSSLAGGERQELRALLGEREPVLARDRQDRRDDERVGPRAVDDLPRAAHEAVDEERLVRGDEPAVREADDARAIGVRQHGVVALGQEAHRGGRVGVRQRAVGHVEELAAVHVGVVRSRGRRRSTTQRTPRSPDHFAMSSIVAGPNAVR